VPFCNLAHLYQHLRREFFGLEESLLRFFGTKGPNHGAAVLTCYDIEGHQSLQIDHLLIFALLGQESFGVIEKVAHLACGLAHDFLRKILRVANPGWRRHLVLEVLQNNDLLLLLVPVAHASVGGTQVDTDHVGIRLFVFVQIDANRLQFFFNDAR